MIPLILRDEQLSNLPGFSFPRLRANGEFEARATAPAGITSFAGAYVDTGATFVIIPYVVHCSGFIKIHANLGTRPYRILSGPGTSSQQPFAEVGIHFLVDQPQPHYRPAHFVIVRAYLLEPNVRPTKDVVIGLDAIRTHFPLYADGKRAFFLEPGDTLQIP